MAWKLAIDGVDRTNLLYQPAGVQIDWTLQERVTFSFTCRPGLLPTVLQEVVIYAQDGTTPIIGGLVPPTGRSVKGAGPASADLFTEIRGVDFSAYADWCYTSASFGYAADVTLKAVLQGLVTSYLSRYGITLDPAQVTGPTLAAFTWNTKRLSEGLRELASRTGYVWRINAGKVLRMFMPGTESAPYALTDAAPHCRDLTWSDSRESDAIPNLVTVQYGPPGTFSGSRSYDGDGVTEVWSLPIQGAVPSQARVAGTPYWFRLQPDDPYVWDGNARTITRGWGPIPQVGETFTVYYSITYPQVVTATTGASPPIEVVLRREDVTEEGPAQEYATKALAAFGVATIDLYFETFDHGFAPGQALAVNLTLRGLNLSAIVTAVSCRIQTDGLWVYQVTATSSTAFKGTALDQWRTLLGGGGASMSGSVVSVTAVPVSNGLMVFLGGSRNSSIMDPTGAWQPVPNYVPFVAVATGPAVVNAELWARHEGVSVQARLWNVTDGASAGTSSVVTSTTAFALSFAATVVVNKTYRLEVLSSMAGEGAFGIGTLLASGEASVIGGGIGGGGTSGLTPADTRVYNEALAGSIDGSNASFTTATQYVAASLELYLNGLRQRPGHDYVEASSNAVTMTVPPVSGEVLLASYTQQ